MTRWEITFAVDASADLPVFVQIAQAISSDVRRGRLRPGARLPGSRALARQIGVHRNTVLAAYAELAAEGWVATSQARGTYVSRELPDPAPRRFTRAAAERDDGRGEMARRVGYEILPGPELYRPAVRREPGMLVMAGGVPDVRLFPAAELARAYRRALRGTGRSLLSYGDAHGHPRLREALAEMLSATRGLVCARDNVMVTRGSQMAIYLAARSLIAPGDVVAVEDPGYRPAWEALRLAGAELVPIGVDAHGIAVTELAELARRRRVRAVYVTPHHQYPTTATMAPGRRLELLETARAHKLAIIEDDYDHEFHYEGRPIAPLASADRAGSVIYVGTLSKVLAPGLRVGYLVAPAPLIERAAAVRSFVDLQGDHAFEAAVGELIEDGSVQRHVRRVRRIYRTRRDVLAAELAARLGDVLDLRVPNGGMAIWARARSSVDVSAWHRAAEARGLAFQPGRWFAFDGRPTRHLRLGFALLDESELREAAKRLVRALSDLPASRAPRSRR